MPYDDKLKECAAEIFHFLGVEENPIKQALLRKILSDYFPEAPKTILRNCPQCQGRGIILDRSADTTPIEFNCPMCLGGGLI
jgi:hypothetical protein